MCGKGEGYVMNVERFRGSMCGKSRRIDKTEGDSLLSKMGVSLFNAHKWTMDDDRNVNC